MSSAQGHLRESNSVISKYAQLSVTEKARKPTVGSLVRGIGSLESGGCVKLKTVTEIRRSSACNTLVTVKSIYLVLSFL